MKVNSFRELLLKKAQGNQNLMFMVKNAADDFLSEQIIESLMKMAEDEHRARSSNGVVKDFGAEHLDDHMVSMIHDALSHHASHYKAAVKAGKTGEDSTATQHMRKIHDIMHLSRKLHKDSVGDHSYGRLNIEAVDPKPWERMAYLSTGKSGKMSDTKGWSRTHPTYDYMRKSPSKLYSKEVDKKSHGHKGAYPLEEMKVNGKHLSIDDSVDASEYVPHGFTEHPIFKKVDVPGKNKKDQLKNPAFKVPGDKLSEEHHPIYKQSIEDWEDAGHQDDFDDRHEKMKGDNPDEYAKRGTVKPSPIHETIDRHKDEHLEHAYPHPDDAGSTPPPIPEVKAPTPGSISREGVDMDNIPDALKHMFEVKKSSQSLYNLRDILVKNEEFLKDNPEILAGIEERLLKQDDNESDDADAWLQQFDPEHKEKEFDEDAPDDEDAESSDEEFAGLFDDPEEADAHYNDDDKELVTGKDGEPQYVDISDDTATEAETTPEKIAPEKTATPEKPKKRLSAYAAWKPREDYSPEHKEAMDKLVQEGYSPGDAEILSGAHVGHGNIMDAVKSRVHPHEMSDLMHDRLKGIANEHHKGVIKGEYQYADPTSNPQMATAGSAAAKHDEAISDFNTEKDNLFDSREYKDMTPRQQRVAFREFRREWKKQNPDHDEKMKETWQHQADAHDENWGKRDEKLVEGMKAIAGAGEAHADEGGSISQGSQEMAGGIGGSQAAYQSAGSVSEGDKPTGVTTIKDPHSTLAEKTPELKERYTKKLAEGLKPARAARLARLKVGKGSENE